ncbi:hypothetical protein L1987_11916 [Smallanthus sonchifolius]|uniref:Uncharacterized protein n=1 Tax=Smallanthus sonchifolius TaxID=185202 RepID=A0ACB9JDV6_9ASTR|nr:hypothetical protein L1987_11916 [Smallanthus sonchifolius]
MGRAERPTAGVAGLGPVAAVGPWRLQWPPAAMENVGPVVEEVVQYCIAAESYGIAAEKYALVLDPDKSLHSFECWVHGSSVVVVLEDGGKCFPSVSSASAAAFSTTVCSGSDGERVEIPGARDGDARDLGIELQMRMV